MSYIKIEIGGKERGLKFNQGAIHIFQSKIDSENIAATTGYALIWAGLKANAYVKGEEVDFTFEQVCDWCDELSEDTIIKIITCFQETQQYKKLIKPEAASNADDEDKKKLAEENMKDDALK